MRVNRIPRITVRFCVRVYGALGYVERLAPIFCVASNSTAYCGDRCFASISIVVMQVLLDVRLKTFSLLFLTIVSSLGS